MRFSHEMVKREAGQEEPIVGNRLSGFNIYGTQGPLNTDTKAFGR